MHRVPCFRATRLPGPLGPKGQQGEKQRARLCFGIFVLFLRLCITLDVFILGHPGLAGSKGEKGCDRISWACWYTCMYIFDPN